MGAQTHLIPKTEFARRLNVYYRALADERGWDASGRNMEKSVAPSEPRRSLWAKVYANTQAMNANEIEIAARVFGMTPYAFVTEARYYNGVLPVNVGGFGEDVLDPELEKELRQRDLDLAALHGSNAATAGGGD